MLNYNSCRSRLFKAIPGRLNNSQISGADDNTFDLLFKQCCRVASVESKMRVLLNQMSVLPIMAAASLDIKYIKYDKALTAVELMAW